MRVRRGLSEVLAIDSLPDRNDLGAVRLRTLATRDAPYVEPVGEHGGADAVLLDFDYTVLMPRRQACPTPNPDRTMPGSQVDLVESSD